MDTPKVILDVKGLYTHSYYRGIDPDAPVIDGKAVNTAAFGFQNWLDEYLEPALQHVSPADIIAVYDGGNDYRRSIYPDYKKHRRDAKKDDEASKRVEAELKRLEEATKMFLAGLGAICVGAKGVEADDLIAVICRGLRDTSKMIHTVDADLLQLSDEKTVIFLRGQPQTSGEYKGVPYGLIRLNKALVGDSSDGYIGVPRFGEKAWEHCVREYGFDGMEQIEQCIVDDDFTMLAEAVAETKDRILSHLLAHKEDAKLGYRLASLAPDSCYQFRGNTLVWPKYYVRLPSERRVESILYEMSCPARIERFQKFFPQFRLVTASNLQESIDLFLDSLDETPFFSMDYETVDRLKHQPFNEAMSAASRARGGYVDVLSSEITGMSVTFGKYLQHTFYVSVDHRDTANVPKQVIRDFLETMQETGKPVVVQNAGFEEQVSKLQLCFKLLKPYDTAIMSSYVNENEDAGLKSLSKQWLNYDQTSYKDTLAAAGAADMSELTGEQVLNYGCDDALVTAHLFKVFRLILQMEGMWDFYRNNERAPVHLLNQAFEKGVRIDFNRLGELAEKGRQIIDDGFSLLRRELEAHCTEPNLAAAKHLDEMDGQNLLQIDRANGKHSDTALLARREERKIRWAEAAVYKPYSRVEVPAEFSGTPSQITKVANLILNLSVEPQPKLDTISKPKLNAFITELKTLPDYANPNTPALSIFCDLLGAAAGELKSRSGPNFAELANFCLPYLGSGRVVEEGDELNLNSPQQMQELLYCKLALPVRRRTKVQKDSSRDQLGLDGTPSTDEKAMMLAIAEDCTGPNEWKKTVLQTVIDVKEQQTMFSLYYNPYPLWAHPRDGMIHPSVRNCGTITRRPSGSNPNILQVKKGETRTIYLPRLEEHVIVACDFNGQELRIAGSESRDPLMIEAYTAGGEYQDEDGEWHPVVKDIHSVTSTAFASDIFRREGLTDIGDIDYDLFRMMLKGKVGPKEEEVAKLVRKFAKMVNFLIIYGGQASTLSMNLGISESYAEDIMRLVFQTYRRLSPWQEEVIAFARNNGFVKTAFGNLKHLTSDIRSQDGSLRSRQERQAVNATVQSCAADILKVVMTECFETALFERTGSILIAPVYDEIVASVPMNRVYEYVCGLQKAMNLTPPGHAIPMLAEVSVGPTWGDVEELGDHPSERKIAACIDRILAMRKAA